MKPSDSVTTTSPEGTSSEIGMPLGGHGSAMPAGSSRIAAWLAQRSPEEVDKAAESRVRQHGVELHTMTEWGFLVIGIPSFGTAKACEAHGGGNYAAAIDEVRKFMTPAPLKVIEGWLAELSVITARKQGSDFEEELRLTAYAKRLAEYPADVARHVTLVHRWRFWPSWAEMAEVCDGLFAQRRLMLRSLEQGESPASKERRLKAAADDMTPEQREAENRRKAEVRAEVEQKIAEMAARAEQQREDQDAHWRDRREDNSTPGNEGDDHRQPHRNDASG